MDWKTFVLEMTKVLIPVALAYLHGLSRPQPDWAKPKTPIGKEEG